MSTAELATQDDWIDYIGLMRAIVRARTGVRWGSLDWAKRDVCPMCWDFGWVLDCNDLTQVGDRMVELIHCFYPTCRANAPTIQRLVFKGPQFTEVSKPPKTGVVMSVGKALDA